MSTRRTDSWDWWTGARLNEAEHVVCTAQAAIEGVPARRSSLRGVVLVLCALIAYAGAAHRVAGRAADVTAKASGTLPVTAPSVPPQAAASEGRKGSTSSVL
jgi:hypothetical protein